MRAAVAVAALSMAANLAACGFVLPAAASLPQWCGTEGGGGGPPLPGASARPVVTPDPHHLLCITAENKSNVDMGLRETRDVHPYTWSLISACEGIAASEPSPSGPWSLQVGRAKAAGIVDPVLASLDASQLRGDPPYLIEVIINPDLTATIAQRASLPSDSVRRLC